MELVFNKIDNFYVSEFQVNSDFNLHIERDVQSVLRFYQRTADGGKWDVIQDLNNQVKNLIIDYDCSALIYPKWIKIECEVLPIYAAITTDGEVTEIKTQSKEIEVTDNGITEIIPDAGFAYLNGVKVKTNVPSSGGGNTPTPTPRPSWTGHADVEGLRAIGWTDEDIAYYQENGVNWNEEEDELHKVTDDNKALYGVLTAINIFTYKDRIVYLPKIDTSGKTNMSNMFSDCFSLVSIPQLDTSSATNMNHMFYNCRALVSIPQLDTSSATNMSNMFSSCYSLTHANLKNAKRSYQLNKSALLSKESLLYLINNEAATSAITITLSPYAYTRLAEDADIVAALANHPNISIAQ